jgi:hypothetical protein
LVDAWDKLVGLGERFEFGYVLFIDYFSALILFMRVIHFLILFDVLIKGYGLFDNE